MMERKLVRFQTVAASIQGGDHAISMRNCQDSYFLSMTMDPSTDWPLLIGVISDGCGEGKRTEVGAHWMTAMLAHLLRDYFVKDLFVRNRFSPQTEDGMNWMEHIGRTRTRAISEKLVSDLFSFGRSMFGMDNATPAEFIPVVRDYLLATVHAVVACGPHVWILRSGDGVSEVTLQDGDTATVIPDQNNRPHYLAYQLVPQDLLSHDKTKMDPMICDYYYAPQQLMIGTDGAARFLRENRVSELFQQKGKTGLQRRLQSGHPNFHPKSAIRPEWAVNDDTTIILVSFVYDEDKPLTRCEENQEGITS